MAKTVVALYDRLTDARAALEELVSEGFDRSDISLIANASDRQLNEYFDEQGRYVGETDTAERSGAGEGAAAGAGIGATIGGLGGLLVGLGLLTVPGVGPALAAGPLASTLAGAGLGGAAGGLIGALANAGVPEDEAERYAEGVRRGGTILLVSTDDDLAGKAGAILDRHQAVDIDSREAAWRSRGWERHEPEAEPLSERQLTEEREHLEIPVAEENLRVGKREVEHGGVRARTFVREHPVEEQVTLRDESVDVHREPANRPVTPGDGDAFQERQVEMRETDEEAVVDKQARVIEDVVIDKRAADKSETIRDSVRRTEVDVEELDDDDLEEDFTRYERTFRGHFQDSDISDRYAYDDVMPAYRFGYSLANSSYYRDRDWEEVEPEARRAWEEKNRGTWDDVRDSVRHSWREVRNRSR